MKNYFFLLFFALITKISFSQNNELISNKKLYFWLGSRNISTLRSSNIYFVNNSELELSASYNNWGISYFKLNTLFDNNFGYSTIKSNMFFGFYRFNFNKLSVIPRLGIGTSKISYLNFNNFTNLYELYKVRFCHGGSIELQYGIFNWLSIVGGFNVYSIKDFSLKGITFGLQIGRIRDKKK